MPGYNHYDDCVCGWCVNYGRAASAAVLTTSVRRVPVLESVTAPNAKCPVCKTDVFFYSSPDGGRVYFDELGPPWPKHPCMDPSAYGQPRTAVSRTDGRPEWEREGWIPLRAIRMVDGVIGMGGRRESDWWVIEARDLRASRNVSLLTDQRISLPEHALFYAKEWDDYGASVASYLEFPGRWEADARMALLWRPSRFSTLSVENATRYDHVPPEERWRSALRDAIEVTPPEWRMNERVFYLNGTRYRLPLEVSVAQIEAALASAVEEAHRIGWQESRDNTRRMEAEVRQALALLDLRYGVGSAAIMQAMRAFS